MGTHVTGAEHSLDSLLEEARQTQQTCMTSDEVLFFFSFQQNYGRLLGAGFTGVPPVYCCNMSVN